MAEEGREAGRGRPASPMMPHGDYPAAGRMGETKYASLLEQGECHGRKLLKRLRKQALHRLFGLRG